ncbi:MAG: hypothetical protein LIP77_09735 [Planctomycetes bacterium]|nr:hypothetical protein [Planctomycetota bacterium]
MSSAQERIETVVRNVFAGDNNCGTLSYAVAHRDADYFRRAVAPVIDAYETEAAALRQQRGAALRDAEAKRFALEAIVANLDLPPTLRETVAAALPGRRW